MAIPKRISDQMGYQLKAIRSCQGSRMSIKSHDTRAHLIVHSAMSKSRALLVQVSLLHAHQHLLQFSLSLSLCQTAHKLTMVSANEHKFHVHIGIFHTGHYQSVIAINRVRQMLGRRKKMKKRALPSNANSTYSYFLVCQALVVALRRYESN